EGYDLIADRAHAGGYVSAYASAAQGMASMSAWGQNLQVWPVAQSYTVAENAFLKIWNDPNASQMDKQAAANAFSARLSSMAQTPGIDAGSKTMIEADAQRLLGQDAGDNPSFGQAMLGRGGITPQATAQLGQWALISEDMKVNPLAWAYAPTDANGNFDPTGKGPLGIVPAGSVQPGAQAVMVPGADGKAVMAMVMPHSVYTTDPNNPNASPQLAGYQISYMVGGRTIEMWGYKDQQGGNHWSLTSPLAEGATRTTDNKGDIFVTPRASAATDPIARAAQLDAQFGTKIADQLRAQQAAGAPLGGVTVTTNDVGPDGKVRGVFELSYNNGTFTASQKQNTYDP
ncbi:MAG TPA: hypothetical protein VFH51_11720, partial [Myxococcota bacterium]|nr:hypothetical protein [Myxococcota bacterium]